MADGDVFQILFKTQQVCTAHTGHISRTHNPPVPIIVTMFIIVTIFINMLNNCKIMTRVMLVKA